jgi:hypothetical protein
MRILATGILAIAVISTAAPAWPQTYDPDYPICLRSYAMGGGSISCGYTSLAQCAQSASGRSAQCIVNPYIAGAGTPGGQRHRRARSGY